MADSNLLARLSQCVLEVEARELPPEIVHQTSLIILDSIGCALTTLDEHEVIEAVEAIETTGGAPQATIIGFRGKTSVTNATLANGILVRFLDLNDFTLGSGKGGAVSIGGHPSDNIPVGLAVGEWRGSSGLDVIASVLVGYDVFERMRVLFDNKGQWDGTSVSGTVAAVMTGRLMGFNVDRMRHAIALAAMRSPTPRLVRRGHITAAKFLSNPLIAQSGVSGALLAGGGMTGPQAIFESPDGLRPMFRADADFDRFVSPMEAPYAVSLSHVKAFPCLATGQASVAAAMEMHKKLGGRTDQIEHFDVIMADYPMVRDQQGDEARRYPDSREAADHSFYFLPAVTMIDGTLTMRSYDHARWTEPKVTALMQKGRMAIDPAWNKRAPNGYPCRLEVTLKDGTKLSAECDYAPGHSKGALDENAVVEKFDRLTRDVLPAVDREKVRDLALGLHKLPNIAPLMDLLANRRRHKNRFGPCPIRDD